MRIPDYHIHTDFSPDSLMTHYEAARAAIRAGITEICFTEHMDLGHHMELFNRVPEFDRIKVSIQALRKEFPMINIRYGLEAGYMKETAEETAKVIVGQAFDYVILSIHCVDGMDCYLPEAKRGRDKATAYRRYLEILYESVTDERLTDSYDVVGHIGYIAKCKYYEDNTMPYSMFPELFDEILSVIIKKGKGIEVNTSGINRAGHVLPHPSVIRRYYELGGRIITIGSDAHTPERVGEYVPETIDIVRECGVKEIVMFKKRKPEFIIIE